MTDLSFRKECLFCRRRNTSLRYTCRCRNEDWQNQYRTLAIKLLPRKSQIKEAVQSFQNYSFTNTNLGMLQYTMLPSRKEADSSIPITGLTPLHALKNFSSHYKSNIYIKNEGNNPSGCFKDRETLMCLLNSRRRGLKKAVIYSSGNAAASAALYARKAGFHLVTFVAGDTYQEKIDYILRQGSDVVVIGDESINFETGFRLFAELNASGVFARAAYDNWSVRNPYRVQGDKTIALEIIKQLQEQDKGVPDYVLIPTANGSCLSGTWLGFKELYDLGLISKLPRMVSVGIKGANPVYKAVKSQIFDRPVICDLRGVDQGDAEIGSIIFAEEGYDSIQAARAVVESGGLALEVKGEDARESMHDLFSMEEEMMTSKSLLPEPASLVSLAALKKLNSKGILKMDETMVCVITGHGRKAEEKIRELMEDDEVVEALDEIIENSRKSGVSSQVKKGKCISVAQDFEKVKKAFKELQL